MKKVSGALAPDKAKEIVAKRGFNPSLPFLLMGPAGELIYLNLRMAKLLSIEFENVENVDLKNHWPFFSSEQSREAFLSQLLKSRDESLLLRAEAQLKTFKIFAEKIKAPKCILVVAELVRLGDLLEDSAARQELFHTLSHEIRTSVTGLKGYVDMIEGDVKSAGAHTKRMRLLLGRLDKVVERLSDLKVMLDTEVGKKVGAK